MALVSQHDLTIYDSLVVVDVMKSGSCWSTSTYRQIWFNPTNVIVLLASKCEERVELAFAHPWLAVLHDVDM